MALRTSNKPQPHLIREAGLICAGDVFLCGCISGLVQVRRWQEGKSALLRGREAFGCGWISHVGRVCLSRVAGPPRVVAFSEFTGRSV